MLRLRIALLAIRPREAPMNEEVLNTSLRKFLKKVGVTSQREIEKAVREAVASGRVKGNEALPAKANITIEGIGLSFEIDGAIELE
jgi:Family of unknown function (DUF6494)